MVYYGACDGRVLTSWVPSCDIDENLKYKMNTPSDYDYRRRLQRDALKIMTQNTRYLMEIGKLCNCPRCTFNNLR
jgi:hypothetical protein